MELSYLPRPTRRASCRLRQANDYSIWQDPTMKPKQPLDTINTAGYSRSVATRKKNHISFRQHHLELTVTIVYIIRSFATVCLAIDDLRRICRQRAKERQARSKEMIIAGRKHGEEGLTYEVGYQMTRCRTLSSQAQTSASVVVRGGSVRM